MVSEQVRGMSINGQDVRSVQVLGCSEESRIQGFSPPMMMASFWAGSLQFIDRDDKHAEMWDFLKKGCKAG